MIPMGIGELGSPRTIIKTIFRYTLEFETQVGTIPRYFVKGVERPKLEVETIDVAYLNAFMQIPGRGKWSSMQVTYYDVAHQNMLPLYNWVASVYNYSLEDGGYDIKQSERAGYVGRGVLTMLDGCGTELERWTLYDCWPSVMGFKSLDNDSSDVSTIDLTINYRYASMKGLACVPTPTSRCIGC